MEEQRQSDGTELVASARAQIVADLGGRKLLRPEDLLDQVRKELDEQACGYALTGIDNLVVT